MGMKNGEVKKHGSVLSKPRGKKAAFLAGFAVELAAITALIGVLVPVAVKFIERYWPAAEQASGG